MAPKLLLKKLETQKSGNSWRRSSCDVHPYGATLMLVCGLGLLFVCFLFLDIRTFSSKIMDPVVLQKGFGANTVANHGSQEDIKSRVTPRTQVNVESGIETPEEEADDISEDLKNSDDPSPERKDSKLQSDSLAMPGETESKGSNPKSLADCDVSQGRWVYDESYPLYRSRNCPFADPGFRCEENGRPDTDFMKYRWQPHDCDIPRFKATDMLERLRDQRVVFVGDSLGRNHWESLLCMLAEGIQNKSRIYEVNGQNITKHVGELIFRFEDYNCTVEYFRDPFLVPQTRPPPGSPSNVSTVLRIDKVSWSSERWHGANLLVFNAGHWWSYEKIFRQNCRFQVGKILSTHSIAAGFKFAMSTWASWMEENIDPKKTQVIFRSFASVHFRGGEWNKGGHCHDEVRPLTEKEAQSEWQVPWTNKLIKDAINENIKEKRSAVSFVDVTTSTNYRPDGHAGLYYDDVKIHGLPSRHRQDCSHFCLPGVPDSWNELLYATLLGKGHGVFGEPIRY